MLIGPAGLRGAMAQLVARLVRNEKVRGSSPLSSTHLEAGLTSSDDRSSFVSRSCDSATTSARVPRMHPAAWFSLASPARSEAVPR